MSANKKVSVIVPVYNVEAYIDRCMESLLTQSLKDIEIILVDDGSPDNCPQICDKYAGQYENVKVIHKANAGLGLARNSGMEIATGKYIAFVDSDDFVTQDMCEILYTKAEKYNADIVYGDHYKYHNGSINGPDENITYDVIIDNKSDIQEFMLDMIANTPEKDRDTPIEVSVWAALFKRETLTANNIKFISERVYISEDIVFNMDLYPKADKIVLCSEPIYYYCFNSASLSNAYKQDRFEKDKILWEYLKDKLCDMGISAEERLSRFLLARVRCAMCSVVASEESLGKPKCKELLSKLANDEDVKKAISNYPVAESKKYQKIFFWILKLRNISLLYLLCKLNNKRK